MAIEVYMVQNGVTAEDDALFIACFGVTEEEARSKLEAARERALRLEAHFRALREVDEPLSEREREAIEESRAEFDHGQFRVVRTGSRL